MKLNIQSINLDLTDPIKVYVEEKLESLIGILGRFDEAEIIVDAELERTSNHHKHGEDIFRAHFELHVPGHTFVASAEEWDARVAIDSVKKKLKIEISNYLEAHEHRN